MKQEVGPHQTPNLPWFWASQPLKVWGKNFCCLSWFLCHIKIYAIFVLIAWMNWQVLYINTSFLTFRSMFGHSFLLFSQWYSSRDIARCSLGTTGTQKTSPGPTRTSSLWASCLDMSHTPTQSQHEDAIHATCLCKTHANPLPSLLLLPHPLPREKRFLSNILPMGSADHLSLDTELPIWPTTSAQNFPRHLEA